MRELLAEVAGPAMARDWVADEQKAQRAWSRLAALGLFQTVVPEDRGGIGLGIGDLVGIVEELGRALAPPIVTETLLVADLLGYFAPESLQDALLPALGEGRARIAVAVEPPERHGPHRPTVLAESVADSWRLSGTVLLVPDARDADYLVVAACRAGGEEQTLFICPTGASGLTRSAHRTADQTVEFSSCRFDGVVVGDDHRLAPASGTEPLERLLGAGALLTGAELLGVADATFTMALSYVKERAQFGRPIGSFQAVKHMLADMYLGLEMSRTVTSAAGQSVALLSPEADLSCHVAKAFSATACRRIVRDALQLHGGIGFAWEHDYHLFLKRAKYLEQAFGSAEWHREQVAASVINARRSRRRSE